MNKTFYISGFISSSILLPVMAIAHHSPTLGVKLVGLLPLTCWWVFTGLGTVLGWGKTSAGDL